MTFTQAHSCLTVHLTIHELPGTSTENALFDFIDHDAAVAALPAIGAGVGTKRS